MRYTTLAFTALLTLSTTNLFASGEPEEHSDIEFVYSGGQIDIEFTEEGPVFEAEFPASAPFETDDPGFEGDVVAGDIIDYNILGPLVYHDGTDFAPVPTGAAINITDFPSGGISVDASTTSGSGTGVIGIADATGEAHTHIDFELTFPGSPVSGAYGILMEISTDAAGIDNSAPFYIVFNLGLAEETYEGAVGAFAATVPEPTAGLMLAVGATLVAAARRR